MSAKHWEDYHRTGRLVTCCMGTMQGHTGEVLATWREFFAKLPDGAKVVDIGTGNGAIPVIARDVARDRGVTFEIHGVDYAKIDPPADVPDGAKLFEGIRFHPGVRAEKLPFETGSIDAITGQFALEYTDIAGSLREIARVSRGDGRGLFLLHHVDSVAAANARESLKHGELVMRDTKVFQALRRYLEAERLTPVRAPALHRRLTEIGRRLQAEAARSSSPQILEATLQGLARLFDARGRVDTSGLLKAVDALERSVRFAIQRLDELAGASLTAEGIDSVAKDAQRLGFEAQVAPQYHDTDKLVAWKLELIRREPATG
jgi:ubiquinone/menaquinone biosynthesis C-methylase UbiE